MEQYINKIINADCLDVLRELPDKCVSCICVDPPYFGIVKNDWDNQWKDLKEFRQWVDILGKEFYRVLKDNGSFYWFGSWENIAYCQVELDKYFNLLNNIAWDNGSYLDVFIEKSLRKYALHANERILFYDKGEDKTGLEMIKEIMPNPFAEYLKSEFKKANVTRKEISKLFPSKTGGLTGCVSNWLNGDNIITKEQYLKIKDYLGKAYLTREYEELRREYEELRRVWNNDKKAFDVLKFPICQDKHRFHETQKPLQLITYLLERSTKENDLVLDCFSGSGTTAIACHNLNRRFICVEKDKEYWQKSVERLEIAQSQLKLFNSLT